MRYPRFVLGGAYSGVGKTSVSVALMGALKKNGVHVQPYKVGPDYVDPAFHSFVTGVPSRNLDSWIVAPDVLRELFTRTAPPEDSGLAGVSVIEGVMGLFDGNGVTSEGGTAHVARTLSAPVVLIVSGEGIARSLGALVRGYRDFDPDVTLAGVIVNKVSGERHYRLLENIVRDEAGLRCYGYLPQRSDVVFAHRPLGLIPPGETADIRQRIDKLADLANETIDTQGLINLAQNAPPLKVQGSRGLRPLAGFGAAPQGLIRIGVPKDAAFSAYYEDNFDLLRELGAKIAFFDALNDAALPEGIRGLYLGGGSLEVFAPELSGNTSLMGEILKRLENGMPAYAEGAGAAYLCRRLVRSGGEAFRMAGFLEEDAFVTERLPHFGHVTLTYETDTPLGRRGTTYRANEFHRLKIGALGADGQENAAYRAGKPNGLTWRGGRVRKNVLASLAQAHFYANRALAENFLNLCRGEAAPAV